MMNLCKVCKSIAFEQLPPFPQQDYRVNLTGLQHVHPLYRSKRSSSTTSIIATTEQSRVRHHRDINLLRQAATEGCELCILILAEADALLAELRDLDNDMNVKRKPYPPPNFDMWLTQRPEGGGHGFWVLSGCHMNTTDTGEAKVIIPIAAFTIVTEQDSPFAHLIRGRPIKSTVDIETLGRVSAYVAECDRDHDDSCRRHLRSNSGSYTPQRLLDLETPDYSSSLLPNTTIRLVELGNGSSSSHPQQSYVALSYPCESGIPQYWESDSSAPSSSSVSQAAAIADGTVILVADLAKTFQDAILATRALGVRYLWIDSLCIPAGGNFTEWQRSSPEAGLVYTNAYLTISATGATNPLGGLFYPRPERRYAQIPYKDTTDGTISTILASTLPLAKEAHRTQYVKMDDEPISSGVWSFQERLLSRRIIHFASDQVYVECRRQFVSEDGLLDKKLHYHHTATTETLSMETDNANSPSLKSRWFALLWDYGQREPANPAHKLTALSNVARAFNHMLYGEGNDSSNYIAGHWRDSLIESLCWQSLQGKQAGDNQAPSWSWSSINGIPAMGFEETLSHHYFATVIDTQVNLADEANPFGQVTSAHIRLDAPPLIPLQLVEQGEANCGGSERVRLRSENGIETGIFVRLDTVINQRFVRDNSVFALVLAETQTQGESSEGTLHGLIVTLSSMTPSGGGGGGGGSGGSLIRRLGIFLADSLDLGPRSLFDTRETITLV